MRRLGQILGRSTFWQIPYSRHQRAKCRKWKKKSVFVKIKGRKWTKMGVTTTNNRFWAILVIFFGHFSLGKTAIPPSILARTQNPSVTIKIFRKLKYDLSFVDLGPKLTVLALLSRHSQKMAIIQEEPWKFGKLPVPRKWKKSEWVQRENCGPGCIGDMHCWQKLQS